MNKDCLFLIAIHLKLPDLLIFSEAIYKERYIWDYKIKFEFPEYNGWLNLKPKNVYIKLYSLNIIKEKLELEESLEEIYNLKVEPIRDRIKRIPRISERFQKLIFYRKNLNEKLGELIDFQYVILDNNRMKKIPKINSLNYIIYEYYF